MGGTKTLALIVIGVTLCAQAASQAASADDKLAGTWKLESWVVEDVVSKETTPVFGEHPNGYLILTPQGRMMGLLTAQGRKPPQSDTERETAYRSMLAYSGRYHIDGDKFVVKVDAAWNEAWVGTEQVRAYKLDGTKLQVTSLPAPNPNLGGKTTRGIFTFEREVQ